MYIHICRLYFQGVIFHVEVTWLTYGYKQCTSFGSFPTPAHELAYNTFTVSVFYVAPLLVMIVTFLLTRYEMCSRSQPVRRKCNKKSFNNIFM